MSAHDDEIVPLRVPVTIRQFRELSRRAGVGVLDGRARGEYIIGCALDEPRDELLERVQRIRDAERERSRNERAPAAQRLEHGEGAARL